MEDKKKNTTPKQNSSQQKKQPKHKQEPIKDIDDLIFADEVVKLHSEK